MTYTEYGLKISLDEMEKMIAYARERAEFDNMEPCIYISGGEKPQITQYCYYADCNPIDHTRNAKCVW